MGKKLGTAVVIAVLLLSGVLAGVSYGGSAEISDPKTIALTLGKGIKAEERGPISQDRCVLLDENGDRVGTLMFNSVFLTDWHVTVVYRLQAIEGLERGTIVATGIFGGFSGESLAVTGGTGAYANVRGYTVLSVDGDAFIHTLHLTS